MTDITYAMVDAAGNIVNRIVANPSFAAPAGMQLVQEPDGTSYEIGGTIIAGAYKAPVQVAATIPPPPPSVFSQDLMTQFTAADAAAIQAAVASNAQFWLLWSAMQAQKDAMIVTNARFLAGWSALVQVLGQPRMTAIATALNVTIG